ncbi:MAG: aldo/keto reductase [Candidatus Omnitrophica bacterium]|nr:aldo/keto reductase [Candidatus Omnitrophota bacterium]
MPLSGFATSEGTMRYRDRLSQHLSAAHYRECQGLWLSSIGLGTYLGEPDAATDNLYHNAVIATIQLGGNVIDTAINYRFQRSERVVGQALDELIRQQRATRDELCIATKGGFIPFDGSYPDDPGAYIRATFLDPGIVTAEEIVADCHCLSPAYLQHQLNASRQNLRLECLDVYYIHNPEMQLEEVSRSAFLQRMTRAFACLEEQVRQGAIRWYGTATWNGYRVAPSSQEYLSLEELVRCAEQAGGAGHHFAFIQLPCNLAMPEAAVARNQRLAGHSVTLLDAARHFGMTVMASASILQSRLTKDLPAWLTEAAAPLTTPAQAALQFVRSTPGLAVALVGMKREEHVMENLATAKVPPLTAEAWRHAVERSATEPAGR